MVKKKKVTRRSSSLNVEAFRHKIVPVRRSGKPINLCIYGKTGVGKTTFCATAPDVLLVDCNELGTMSIEDTGIDVTYITSYEEINLLYWFLAKGNHNYKSVAIDTISSLQALCLSFVLGEAAAMDLSKDPKMPDRRDYGKITVLMSDVILQFRNLPLNVIFTAHERSWSEDEGEVEVCPDLPPRVRAILEAAVDILGRLYTKEVETPTGKRTIERRLLVGPHDKYRSKSRKKALGYIIRHPTFPLIMGQNRR